MDAVSSGAASTLPATGSSSSPIGADQRDLARRPDSTRLLALTALGVVFGDIGTSPLYTFSVALGAVGQGPPAAADVLGIVSLILWALLVMVSLKYVVFVLRADNDGEGGILALLSLVAPTVSPMAADFRSWSCSASWARRCSTATASSRRRSPCCRRWRG